MTAILHRLAISFTTTTPMKHRLAKAWHTPTRKECTSHFATLRQRMASHRLSPFSVVQFPKRRMSNIETLKCTWRNQAICLKSTPWEANKNRMTQFLRGQRQDTRQRTGTLALTTMWDSMALSSSKLTLSNIHSRQVPRATLRRLRREPRTWKSNGRPSSNDTQRPISRST